MDGADLSEKNAGWQGEELAPVSAEENKALVRRFLEAQVNADLATLDELLAPDFVDHSLQPGQEPGREDFMQVVAQLFAAVSSASVHFEDQAAEGDKVISRLTMKRTHDRGEFLGYEPTGMELKTTAIIIHRISGGKIAEEWSESSGLAEATRQRLERERIERERVERELQVARRIQQASLPKEVPEPDGWQITPFYQPAREVGGDFYDFHLLNEGNLGVVVGDATGKGVPAALVMSTTCGMLQLAAQALDSSSSPGEVLEQVNETLLARIPSNMFVTCFYCILDPKSATLSYANAGHDLPYLWHGGDAEELRARGMPLGLMPGMSYEEQEVVLDAGDSALFYSDGLVEAHDPNGEMFGFPRLRTLVAKHGEQRSLEEALLGELYSFVGEGWEQEDDITLLTLRRSAT
jgi:serine phosphatase RsbU (regulator of sigma subunit)/ketosteroid isomerase-like protein